MKNKIEQRQKLQISSPKTTEEMLWIIRLMHESDQDGGWETKQIFIYEQAKVGFTKEFFFWIIFDFD